MEANFTGSIVIDETERLRVAHDLAIAQCKDVARQFNEQLDINRLLHERITELLYERNRAMELKTQAEQQAAHFLRQRNMLEEKLETIGRRLDFLETP